MENEILKGNILIAKWLGWGFKDGYSNKDVYVEIPKEFQKLNVWEENSFLQFHLDSNLQWICLEKIAKDKYTIQEVINQLSDNMDNALYTKQDLFEAIVNYIKNKQNEDN